LDFTSVVWLAVFSSVGYLLMGLIVGAIISNAVYKDGGSISDARTFGGISTIAWPIALIVLIFAALWFFIIARALTPQAHREKLRKEREERRAKGITDPQYVD